MRGLNGDAHLLIGKGLHSGHVLKASRGAVHLDPVGASIDLRLDCVLDLRRVHHAPARRARRRAGARRRCHLRQPKPGDEHPRAGHHALVDGIAHGDVGVVRCAEVAHGRDAGLQRPERIGGRGHDDRVFGTRAWRVEIVLVAPVGHVRVYVDHAWNRGVATQVDHARPNGNSTRSPADAHDSIGLYHDDGIAHWSSRGIHQRTESNRSEYRALCGQPSGDQRQSA